MAFGVKFGGFGDSVIIHNDLAAVAAKMLETWKCIDSANLASDDLMRGTCWAW